MLQLKRLSESILSSPLDKSSKKKKKKGSSFKIFIKVGFEFGNK